MRMRFRMFVILLVCSVSNIVAGYNLCDAEESLCPNQGHHIQDTCKIKTTNFNNAECGQVNFEGNEKFKANLGDIHLAIDVDQNSSQTKLNISYNHVKFKKAYIKLSDYGKSKGKTVSCKMYTVGSTIKLPENTVLYDNCFGIENVDSKDYLLEYKAENTQDSMYRKVLFRTPTPKYFDNSVNLTVRQIFSYIDSTNSYELKVQIQPLPNIYNVKYYQVEVFREKDSNVVKSDVRLIQATDQEPVLDFVTYNEEGYYYFKISAIGDGCPEDHCEKSVTPKVHICRKGTPLVIGIVGASCIIPFVLFLFHILTKKYKNQEVSESKDKMLIIYKQTSDKQNDVIKSLVKTIEGLTGIEVWLDPVNLTKTKQKDHEKWCSDDLLLATHIVYICSSEAFQLDYMTYNYLQEETHKTIPDKEIFVIIMPYSSKKDLPEFLSNCAMFQFMAEFSRFISIFRNNVDFENDANYLDLMRKVDAALKETENVKQKFEMPTIIITEQSDGSDSEPREKDVLL